MRRLRICLVSSEIAPFAKTGGLADVAAGLSRFLAGAGHDVRLFMPLYASVREGGAASPAPELRPSRESQEVELQIGRQRVTFSIQTAPVPDSDAWIYFVDCPELYDRAGPYTDDPDEHVRFALLGRAAIEACQRMQWAPDVFHCNDWHTGLLPLQLKTQYGWDRLFAASKTLLTIHNIGYQGVFGSHVVEDLGMGEARRLLPRDDLDAGRVNFLKTGLTHADWLSTVSRTYAHEIQTPELGMGLEGVLSARREALTGIVNGVDYGDWDPSVDPLIAANYTPADLSGKAANKRALLGRFSLDDGGGSEPPARVPVIGIVSRLTTQKGFELLPDVLPVVLHREDMRLVVLGSGEQRHEDYFQWLRDTFPHKVAFYRGYNNELAHLIEAGSDMFLMPSRYEPCGLNQMYSLKYGTVPVVRRTGGLADTVEPFDAAADAGTGFVFDAFEPRALFEALQLALQTWRDADVWARLVQRGMARDFSWERQGARYVELYESIAPAERSAGDGGQAASGQSSSSSTG